MSRVGKLPVQIPSGIKVTIAPGSITVSGAKGELSQSIMAGISVQEQDQQLVVTRLNDEPQNRARHGLMRTLLQNMVKGVSDGFSKQLEITGVGYRVNLSGSDLRLNLGFSHELTYKLPPNVTATVEQNTITINGTNKQQVGQVAAEIRALRKPEPYKGKGIKYAGEHIIRKSGKSGKEA